MEGVLRLPPDEALLQRFAAVIERLPPGRLGREDVTSSDLLLFGTWDVSCYYAPLDHVEPDARVVLVAPCPPLNQAIAAHEAARDALWAGATREDAWRAAAAAASPRGTFGSNLTHMLDGLGIAGVLALAASAIHVTYCLRYPVLVNDRDYTGRRPKLLRTRLLRPLLEDVFVPELAAMPDAMVVPLGRVAAEAVEEAIAGGGLASERCLLGVPNPSGANGHREDDYERSRAELTERVTAWFAAHPIPSGSAAGAG